MVFHKYFYDRVKSVRGDRAGENFIAVTDPDTQLGKDASRDKFRKVFINPADIGGRYSALSYFGLVPAAISGVDVATLLDRAVHAAHIAKGAAPKKNAPAMLGTILGTLANNGRDKLTLITPAPLDTLGLWIEQLIAESTGKEGKGILPVAGEPPLAASEYGNDRVFVCVRMRDSDQTARMKELSDAGHPVVDIVLEDALDLGENFFTWEFATAIAGALIGIDSFDQPNVQESKDNTKRILEEFKAAGKLNDSDLVSVDDANGKLGELLSKATAGDYVALTEYIAESPERDRVIADIRKTIAAALRVATTTGYGPRFLHSTGQLHKGGGANGIFVQMVSESDDIAIPGEPFGFGVLSRAQALGDFQSLASRGRRAIRIDLGRDVDGGLKKLGELVKSAVATKV
jgi:hypothetical protein